MKGNTPIEVMKTIVDKGGPIEAFISQDAKDWSLGIVTGVVMRDADPFWTEDDYYAYCSMTNPTIKKTRPMNEREWALWIAKNPTYVFRHIDNEDGYWRWGTDFCQYGGFKFNRHRDRLYEWRYADLEDLDFPQWKLIPEVEDK
jgi:hypothetical protein